jgi:hypothetical protein
MRLYLQIVSANGGEMQLRGINRPTAVALCNRGFLEHGWTKDHKQVVRITHVGRAYLETVPDDLFEKGNA